MKTVRLTMAQALVRFLSRQMTIVDGKKVPFFAGVWGIFGHGNVAGLGEALYHVREDLPTFRAQNEQGMALAATAYGKAMFRRRAMAQHDHRLSGDLVEERQRLHPISPEGSRARARHP